MPICLLTVFSLPDPPEIPPSQYDLALFYRFPVCLLVLPAAFLIGYIQLTCSLPGGSLQRSGCSHIPNSPPKGASQVRMVASKMSAVTFLKSLLLNSTPPLQPFWHAPELTGSCDFFDPLSYTPWLMIGYPGLHQAVHDAFLSRPGSLS